LRLGAADAVRRQRRGSAAVPGRTTETALILAVRRRAAPVQRRTPLATGQLGRSSIPEPGAAGRFQQRTVQARPESFSGLLIRWISAIRPSSRWRVRAATGVPAERTTMPGPS